MVVVVVVLSSSSPSFPHSLLTDVSFGNFFDGYFFSSSSSNFFCNSSVFSPSTASTSRENSVLECVISCSWETGLGLGSTSVTSVSFPKSTCSPGARHLNSFSGFQTANSWGGDNKLQICKGKSHMHHFTQTNPQSQAFPCLLSTSPLSYNTGWFFCINFSWV